MRRSSVVILALGVALTVPCQVHSAEETQTLTTPAQLKFATSDASDFTKMGKPKSGEWLHRFNEPGQTHEQYVRCRPVSTDKKRNVIVFLPVGKFTPKEQKILEAAAEFAGIWYQLPVRIDPQTPLPAGKWQRKRRFPWQKKPCIQYRTDYFLDVLLPRRIPDDAVCYVAVTMGDLYPDESWNYVFGQASLRNRVGVYSLTRYFASFWGQEETDETRTQALRRSCKLVTHEIGHMFSLQHCIYYECNMNGSNSLQESDSRPLSLCPVCLKKLQWNLKFDILKRYRRLGSFFKKHGLKQEAVWMDKRVKKIEEMVTVQVVILRLVRRIQGI